MKASTARLTFALALSTACVAGSVAHALPRGTPLPGGSRMSNYMTFGDRVDHPPPINPALGLFRGVTNTEAATPGVTMAASFYLEHRQASAVSNPWGVYSEVRSNHAQGVAAVAMYGRLRNEGTGWGAALHAEPIATGSGTTVGVNVETSPMVTGGRVIGVNVQASNGYAETTPGIPTNQGINLQTDPGVQYDDAVRYECRSNNAMHFAPESSGQRAIWIEGTYSVGLDAGTHAIRVAEGTPIQLEGTGAIAVVYRAGRIEFRNGARVLGYLVTDGTATGGRLN